MTFPNFVSMQPRADISNSGDTQFFSPRVLMKSDGNWSGWDVNYGMNYHLYDDSFGTGATPEIPVAFVHFNTLFLNAGDVINYATFSGYVSNDEVTGIDVYMGVMRPTDSAEWGTNISDVTYDQFLLTEITGAGTTAAEPFGKRIDIGHVVEQKGFLMMTFRPTASPVADRFWYSGIGLNISRTG